MTSISRLTSQKFANMSFSFVCAILVVCHHFAVIGDPGSGLWWFAKLLGQGELGMGGGLSWIAVPWFFFASGFFLAGHMDEKGWWRREAIKRLRTLVMPFFFWCIAGIALLSVMDVLQGRHLFFGTLNAILKGVGAYPNSVVNPMASQLWFVRALVMLVIISPIILRFMGVWWLVATFVLYAIVAPFDGLELHPFFRYGFSLEGLFYFSIGLFLRRHFSFSVINLLILAIVCCILGMGLLILHSVAFLQGVYLTNYLNYIATPLLLCGLWSIIPSSPFPKVLTSAAFPIYLMHRFFWWPMNGFVRKIFSLHEFPPEAWVIVYFLVLGVVCPIVAAWVLRRSLPCFANFAFGGR